DFDAMTIFDADLLAQLAKRTPPTTGAIDAAAAHEWNRFLTFEQQQLKRNLHLRAVQALLNAETTPLFLGVPAGKKFSGMLLMVDGQGYLDGEETALQSADDQRGGMWYSSHLRGEK